MPTNLFLQEKTPFRLLYMFFDPPTQIVILERLILEGEGSEVRLPNIGTESICATDSPKDSDYLVSSLTQTIDSFYAILYN